MKARVRDVSTFGALRHRDYRFVWFAFMFSAAGTQMQTFGLGWFVVQLADQAGTPQAAGLYLGLVAATRIAPMLLLGLIAGSIADRVDRRRLLTASNFISGVVAAAFAAAVLTDRATLPVVLALSTLAATVQVFAPVTSMAMVPRLVPARAIASAVGLMLTTQSLAALFGPLLGGVLIGPIGVGGLMAFNALSYLAIVAAGMAIRPMPPEAATSAAGVIRSIGDAFVFLWRNPVLRRLFAFSGALALAGRPFQQLLPAVAHDVLHVGAVQLSFLYAAAGAGALGASFLTATFGGSSRRGTLLGASGVVLGVSLALFALQDTLVPALVFVAAAATGLSVTQGLHVAIYQAVVPDEMRGRVTAISANANQTGLSLGALLLGLLGSVIGIDVALLAASVLIVLAAGWGLSNATLRYQR